MQLNLLFAPCTSSFFKKSSVSTDQFYQALKYPEGKKGKIYHSEELIEKGAEGLSFFKHFVKDINKICREAVKLGYTILEA
ncbi:hypothetical protein [Rhodohalobacter sp.]|uniref:hypothetical protein n=1 Tax=Rhodohalobacter sp. TaxID=1974210 RepID=UPI002ACD39A6|nr:hypothetical protein [Rhodohalobacter sp.]MDZ7755875.1 hypothetical protein [Rhodohalobacter sp.]